MVRALATMRIVAGLPRRCSSLGGQRVLCVHYPQMLNAFCIYVCNSYQKSLRARIIEENREREATLEGQRAQAQVSVVPRAVH